MTHLTHVMKPTSGGSATSEDAAVVQDAHCPHRRCTRFSVGSGDWEGGRVVLGAAAATSSRSAHVGIRVWELFSAGIVSR